MLAFRSYYRTWVPGVVLFAALLISAIPGCLLGQTTVGTGSIVGTVSDPSGAVVSGAKLTISNVATGQVIHLITNESGSFNSGALTPGSYKTQISAERFSTVELSVVVQVGNTATLNVNCGRPQIIFDKHLRHTRLPALELERWKDPIPLLRIQRLTFPAKHEIGQQRMQRHRTFRGFAFRPPHFAACPCAAHLNHGFGKTHVLSLQPEAL